MPFSQKTPEFVTPLLWPLNSHDLNIEQLTQVCAVCGILQDKVYQTCMTDVDDLKHRIRTEWTKLDHAVIAASVHQLRGRLSGMKAGGGHFEHLFLI